MIIGYNPKDLLRNISKHLGDIQSEHDWAAYYRHIEDIECVEDCVRNIMDSCTAIMENIENLKGEEM